MLLYQQIKKISPKEAKPLLENFLKEDGANKDITSNMLINKKKTGAVSINAREEMVFCGTPIIQNIFSKKVKTKMMCKEGDQLKKSTTIAELSGSMHEILIKERVLLNLIQRMSGISTLTNQYVKKLNSKNIHILDTRKTTPGMRLFEKYAVNIGGGSNHRLNLSSGILIKDNHLAMIQKDVWGLKKLKQTNKPIQIEIDDISQITEKNIKLANGYLLDNMTPSKIVRCIKKINQLKIKNKKIFIEVSGGINIQTIHRFNIKGVNGLSVGALTHQAQSIDIGLDIK